VDNSAVSWVILGKRRATNSARFEWEAIGASIPGPTTPDLWQVVDVTAAIQSLMLLRESGQFSAYALVPAPAVGPILSTDLRGLLVSLLPSFSWTYVFDEDHPDEEVLFPHVHDYWYQPSGSGEYTTWDSLTLGEMIVEFRYPGSERGRSYSWRNAVRADSPDLG
jgi:hypothetical protein